MTERSGDPMVEVAATDDVVLSVVAPCFNESGNIALLGRRTLQTIDEMGLAGELILVDDGSRDETWALVQKWSMIDDRVRGVRHGRNLGIEASWRSGLQSARGTLVGLIDADLQNRPEDLALLYEAFERGDGDVIQAVRHASPKGQRYRVFSRGLNALLNLMFGMRARDNKSGFLLTRRDTLLSMLQHRFRYRYFQSFIGVAAHTRELRIAEVDTIFQERHAGRSFLGRFPVRVALSIVWEAIKLRWELRATESRNRLVADVAKGPRTKPFPSTPTILPLDLHDRTPITDRLSSRGDLRESVMSPV